ncbi:unnamed protein product [Rhizopus stolonifer]
MTKRGWIQLRRSTSDTEKRKKNVYAELKCSALFIYDSDQEKDCQFIIPVHSYKVSIHTTSENDTFGRSTLLCLRSNDDDQEEYYMTCERAVDKEDWYFGLLSAASVNELDPIEMIDSTHFDPMAMKALMSTIQQDADYRQVQWLNAIVGRIFLGMYKTKLPSLLGEIHVQSVDIGHSVPFVTQPKLLSLTPEGELSVEAVVDYTGSFKVVIQTDCSYSLLRVPLVLSVTLKQLSGKFLFKVKPPPSNRYWIGFYELPQMEWEITPIVSDKQIKLSMVTNAIESKIREFMMENMVLPNMDDFPFYTSQGKGGIFGERVPRPSRSEQRTSDRLSVDMLGNKLVQETESPKIDQRLIHDDILMLPKPPTRRAESVDILESHSKNNYRTSSAPEIRNRARNHSLPATSRQVALGDLDMSHCTSASSSISNLKFGSQEKLSDESSILEPIHPLESDTESDTKKPEDSDPESKESIRSFKYNKAKLINNMTNKKQVFYNMTGNLFNKKNKFIKPKITKELKEERDRELQELHNRKMMGLFLTSPTRSEEASY